MSARTDPIRVAGALAKGALAIAASAAAASGAVASGAVATDASATVAAGAIYKGAAAVPSHSATAGAQDGLTQRQVELARAAAWGPEGEAQRALDELRLELDEAAAAVPRATFLHLEEVLREGPPLVAGGPAGGATEGVGSAIPGAGAAAVGPGGGRADSFAVELPDGPTIPVLVQAPAGYNGARRWPLILAMHGGPVGDATGAFRGATRMIEVWREPADRHGWIVVSPAMTHVVARGPRTADRLPYEILRPEQARAILGVVQRRLRVDPDRIVSTGISLGSNFSLGFAASMPDRFAAIVPVSTEGDSREHLLRNLQQVPAYVLEGTQDRNIRGISGPRALGDILARFAYDVTYREFGDRAHEGFQEVYPDVLRWLSSRPRRPWPREVLRVPHDGIMPLSRRVFWVESDTRQGLVHARVADDNHIEITSRWNRSLTLYLHDRLVDLDRPIELTVNGVRMAPRTVSRSVTFALRQVRDLDDPGRAAAASLTVEVPLTGAATEAGRRLWESLAPVHPPGPLSFWEFYAVNALIERFPTVGLRGREVELPPALGGAQAVLAGVPAAAQGAPASARDAPVEPEGQRAAGYRGGAETVGVAIDIVDPTGPFGRSGLHAGDVLLEVDGEPFFAGRGGLDGLHHWLIRELTAVPRDYDLWVWRDGRLIDLAVPLALGPYRDG